ncbi:MAG: sodium:solute symporter [Fidelibacterota bacterium]
MHPLDLAVLILYLVLLVYLGLRNNRQARTTPENFILAGRRLSLPGFIATLVATWYGGILGVGENTYLHGIQTWFIFGLPYYVFGLLFALLIAGRIQQGKHLSVPDHFHHHYGKTAGVISALYILFLSSPAPYILSIGILLQFTLHISFELALLSATAISMFYIWFGGFRAVVRTDMLQFSLMFTGFILLLIFAWTRAGNPLTLITKLPPEYLNPTGGQSLQYILVWFFIALWTFVDPGFYQRCAAAKSKAVARKGILISLGFWFIFDLLTVTTGLYAKVLLPPGEALFAYPRLAAEVLPPLFYGLFFTGILATIMSTIDSLGFISAITFGRDLKWRIETPTTPDPKTWHKASTALIQKGLIAMAFLALILAISIPSVVRLWYVLGSLLVPGLLIPFLLTFSRQKLLNLPITQLLVFPVLVSGGWFLFGKLTGKYPLMLEPFYPGLLSSLAIFLLFRPHANRN